MYDEIKRKKSTPLVCVCVCVCVCVLCVCGGGCWLASCVSFSTSSRSFCVVEIASIDGASKAALIDRPSAAASPYASARRTRWRPLGRQPGTMVFIAAAAAAGANSIANSRSAAGTNNVGVGACLRLHSVESAGWDGCGHGNRCSRS